MEECKQMSAMNTVYKFRIAIKFGASNLTETWLEQV